MQIVARIRGARRAVAALAFAALLVACAGPQVPITGTITDAYTGQPVGAAQITLGSNTLTTDAAGNYQIPRWSIKDQLTVSASGYEPVTIDLATKPQLERPQPPAVSLDTIAIRPNTLSGVITDAYTGEPVDGALVKVTDAISATTAADGSFSLAGLPESFVVEITKEDYEPLSESLARTTTFDAAIRPNVLTGQVTDRFSGAPVAGATVRAGEASAETDAEGRYRLVGVPEQATVTVDAEGYAELTQPVERVTTLDAVLRPDVLKGTLVDATTGEPVPNATVIATTNLTSSDVAYVRVDNSADGSFTLDGIPEQGFVQVLAPGYRKTVIELKPGSVPERIELEPFAAKALYVTAAVASNWDLLMEYFDAIDRTELNAIVIDLKSDLRDDLGLIYYDSQVPIVKELGTSRPNMDLPRILEEAKRRGIYTIARVHIFSHDNVLADAKPEWAAKDRITGGVFADYPAPNIRYAWLDPWNQNVWDYNIQLSVEAALMGFDEINYDYIRFPSLEFAADDKDRLQLSREGTAEEKFANIVEVLKRSHRAINGAGAFFSVDVFGYTAFRPSALIGQDLSLMAEYTDYVMPMVYPSHFVPGEFGFDNPAEHPYEVIAESMKAGAEQVAGKRALVRPWLQEFTLVWVPDHLLVEYGPAEVRAQIQAVEDHDGRGGWILYDSANDYNESALKPE
ncbi:MAG: putative glycoside hydrolase [Chloroflexota bacterium]|nr:MAG: hypothetical protein DIU80_10385 [Chloroflexota bacterium]